MRAQRRTVRAMSSDDVAVPLLRVEVKILVEVTDDEVLQQLAIRAIDERRYISTEDGVSPEELAEEARALARADIAEALAELLDPESLVENIGPVVSHGSTYSVALDRDRPPHGVPEDAGGVQTPPDFGALFSCCTCGKDSCDRCSGFQFTPRTAAVLWAALQILADAAYNDVEAHGDDPVADERAWQIFGEYPRITYRQDAVWRRQAARSFDDLAADLEAGHRPLPRCPAEEMALHLALDEAPDLPGDEDPIAQLVDRLPRHPADFAWDMCGDRFVQDTDILRLFDDALDGMEDPDDPINRELGIGDYRPSAWFRTFLNKKPRDGRRPFRR